MKKVLKNFALKLKSNIKTIITAVITSAVIWFAISLQIFPDVTITISDIPVRIAPTSSMIEHNLQLTEDYELTANVQVRGKRYDIGILNSSDFQAVLNLTNVEDEGEHVANIIITSDSPINFEILPSNQNAKIKIERIESKTLEITPRVDSITVADGMTIDTSGLSVNPPTVTISGEKSVIDLIERAEVHAVHSEEMHTSLSLEGELVLFNNENIRVSNPDVDYDSEIFSVTVPIHMVRTLPLDFIITGAPSNFNLQGLRSMMDIPPYEITLSSPDMSISHLSHFDVGEMSLNEIDMQMLLFGIRDTFAPKLPEGYKNISGYASFSLQFRDVEDYTQYNFAIPWENINILNKPVDFDVEILTRELTVTVLGPASFIHAMAVSDIIVTLNLLGIPEITEDSRFITRSVQCRIRGTRVPAWVVGDPQVDVNFTRITE
ncbi:MAG: hypothetical protein LBC82_08390 [Oscillospiraceae bacterium]|jgi:hypothetical protein|nr:hypothetical protein [Oscillospiraceae bacterium]